VSGVTVVVDFGATDTVGVLRGRGEAPQSIVMDGEARMPSAVALSQDDQLVVGREAIRLGTADPDRAVMDLRNRLDGRDVMVGDLVLPVARLVRTLLSRVIRSVGAPVSELVLTHPASWPSERVQRLTQAAVGLVPSVRSAVGPLAAAAGSGLEPDQTMLVVELDGDAGTMTTVRRKSGRLTVLSTAELPPDAELVKLAKSADAVLVVGRSSRTAGLSRRLVEQGRAVRSDPDPATAVARGALALLEETPAPTRIGNTRPWLRRAAVSAAGVVLVLALGAVLALGWGPGLRMAGSPGPAAGALVDGSDGDGVAMPPVVDGREMVTAGQQTFLAGRQGSPARYRTTSGATLAVTVKSVRAWPQVPTLGDAPAGYRWMVAELTGSNTVGPDWKADLSRSVSLLDDRGLWIRPVGEGVIECSGGAKPPEVVKAGEKFDACVAAPVPDRTPVTAVVFGAPSHAGDTQAPIRVPVSVAAVAGGKSPTSRVVGRVGDPPVEVELSDSTTRAGFDVVLTPSGYLGDRRPAAGNRFVVVRATLGAADDVFLRDDRGVLSRPVSGFDRMPTCPPFTGPGSADRPVYACFVYELSAGSPVAGITYGDLAPDAALSGKDLARWPTWTTS
jgi:hypothetical protein